MVEELIACSFDCAELLRQALPVFLVRPVQALDTRQVRPRGHLELAAPGSSGANETVATIELDLFEAPARMRQLRPAWPLETRRVRPADALAYEKSHGGRAITT